MGFREGSNQSAQAQCNLPGSLRGLFRPVLLLSGRNPPRTKHGKQQLDTPNAHDCCLLRMWCARSKPSASFRPGPQRQKREKSMSTNRRLKKRFEKPRPMTSISIRMPEDVLENLKEVSTALGFSGYQPLIRFYIGQSLRKDLARIEGDPVAIMADSLRRHGVADAVIEDAVAEATKG